MGVRPPGDGPEAPETVAFGIAAVDDRLSEADLSFPATSEEVRAALADEAVPYDASGHTLSLEEALTATDRDRFEDEDDLLAALHPVFEERRRSAAGLLGRLLSMLPP